MRAIDDILNFRGDLAPFLAHLTRRTQNLSARQVLEQILVTGELRPGASLVSDARFGGFTNEMTDAEKNRFFSALCFTETPLSEIHCLLEIAYRAINLEPYGFVFVKSALRDLGVNPVLYFNNEHGHIDSCIRALFSLKDTHPLEAAVVLPLVSIFGRKIHPPGAQNRPPGIVDFLWEREWRYPHSGGAIPLDRDQIFCGLCPHDEIPHFEALFQPVKFIDPRRTTKWYASSLIHARQRLDLKTSVV